jgi:CBS domain-containing protein
LKNSERFLSSFSAIERHLGDVAASDRHLTFYHLVARAAEKSPSVRRYAADLREYADLRNAIVHHRSENRVIAEPSDEAVAHLKAIEDLLLAPPHVIPMFQKEVVAVSPSATVAKAVVTMRGFSFSQLPVVDHGGFKGLLTTDAIARWLASQAGGDLVSLAETCVADVLDHAERRDNYAFAGRSASVFDALEQFERFAHTGRQLDAILVTESGAVSERIIGLITVYDIPKILETIEDRR